MRLKLRPAALIALGLASVFAHGAASFGQSTTSDWKPGAGTEGRRNIQNWRTAGAGGIIPSSMAMPAIVHRSDIVSANYRYREGNRVSRRSAEFAGGTWHRSGSGKRIWDLSPAEAKTPS